jgi:hypothetical protein
LAFFLYLSSNFLSGSLFCNSRVREGGSDGSRSRFQEQRDVEVDEDGPEAGASEGGHSQVRGSRICFYGALWSAHRDLSPLVFMAQELRQRVHLISNA